MQWHLTIWIGSCIKQRRRFMEFYCHRYFYLDCMYSLPIIFCQYGYQRRLHFILENMSSLLFNVMFSPVFLKRLFRLFSVTAIVVVLLKVILIQYFNYAIVIWSTIAGATILFVIPGYIFLIHRLKHMSTTVYSNATTFLPADKNIESA